ncbi:histone-lysine N-methyltransferase ATX2-like [Olea europaea subsp. europaea]|uniref:Histone-lysine N-methyltransferase ATX2-like n=1 Tax=Olea europaea subsp. europaea TaxID=158383 RepID=A0A8S0V3W9_OLEEU|nr:histone-lysine N-methyltransferase ATX2-like [Olea europaea subsp. europaea]
MANFPSNLLQIEEGKKGLKLKPHLHDAEEDDLGRGNRSLKYVPLCDVYSATSPYVSASGSKKVKATRKLPLLPHIHRCGQIKEEPMMYEIPRMIHVYSRRRKRKESKLSFFEKLILKETNKEEGDSEEGMESGLMQKKQKTVGDNEEMELGVYCKDLVTLDDQLGSGETRNNVKKVNSRKNWNLDSKVNKSGSLRKRKNIDGVCLGNGLKNSGSIRIRKWVWLSFEGVDPKKFIGLQCKVFWPLDADWYSGRVVSYISETSRHHVKYEDGDEETLNLSNERVKFYVSSEEMQSLKLRYMDKSSESDGIDVNEMVALAASLDDCHELEPGEIIWAKLTGHAMWPSIILSESLVGKHKGLNRISGGKSVPVQFFGTHDFARVTRKQVISFLRGLLSSCHLKCKKPNFIRALEEAKMYLSEQKLPKRMLRLQDGVDGDDHYCENGGDEESGEEECVDNKQIRRKLEDLKTFPFEGGDLRILSLGKIVRDSDNFQDERFIWPEGYTATRKFLSTTDPSVSILYKMEVLRDADSRTKPLFRVTSDNGEEFKGSTPSVCWNKIYKRIRKVKISSPDCEAEVESERGFESGSDMFGFSHPEVSKLLKELSNGRLFSESSQSSSKRHRSLPSTYRPVHVEWKDLDKCNVCHMDEEYENNLFLQCDKCRMMVHARCYGEPEPNGSVLWLCNLCRPGATDVPPCCLCPLIGGAMKPTTDGRWAHLACAIWIPETCLSDIKKMEPIDGISRIHKDRWKLLCSICGVSYGACIQCSNSNCRVSYHPLCARAAGFCLEPADEDRLHLIPFDEDEEDQCIQLLSFCRRHRPASKKRLSSNERFGQKACEHADYTPPLNPTGCARTEPYNCFGRRGRKEPEVLAAASSKRLYVENKPYLVGGYSPHMSLGNKLSTSALAGSKYSNDLQKLKTSQLDPSRNFLSMAEKYKYMRETFKKRLAFGKSGIHGFGVFAKCPHRAGDMVIEYTGELIRPPVADRREHLIYNSLVGAGTYMFRIDEERVIDATRAGSIAHLINHSCEPNCYSRVISVNGDEHIIIFAKRDIKQWEELTYDYRFFSIDEHLACYCGNPRCRGVVNDTEAEERVAKIYAPVSELIGWQGE